MVVKLSEKHVKGTTQQEPRWKDSGFHFVLRLAVDRMIGIIARFE